MYGNWSIKALKEELCRRGARTSGKKSILVQRLIDYDSNNNFGNEAILESEFQMELPHQKFYRDVTADSRIPHFTEDDLNLYWSFPEDEQLMINGTNMYKERYLNCLRFSIVENMEVTYLSAQCSSAFRKHVFYKIDIKLQESSLDQAQCECAAGMGPKAKCKHIFVVTKALLDFTDRKDIVRQVSCTEKLQSFHRPQRYMGSPKKARNLKLKRVSKDISDFDPRPLHLRQKENYPNHFKNACINYAANHPSMRQMSVLQMIPPANIPRILIEHDYVSQEMDDLHVLSPARVRDLEIKTRGQSSNKLWVIERCNRLQSSNFGKICKATFRCDKRKMCDGFLSPPVLDAVEAVQHGLKYEDEAIQHFCQETGLQVQRCGLFVSSEKHFLGSSPDGLVGEDAVLEIKCPLSTKNRHISSETVPYLYFCDRTGAFKLDRTHNYYYQIQGEMYCSNRKQCYFVIYTLINIFVELIARDDDFINSMVIKLEKFYYDYFCEAKREKNVCKHYNKFF